MNPSPSHPASRRLPRWLVAVLLVALGWTGWVATWPERSRATGTFEVGFPILLGVLAVWSLWMSARREDLPAEFRKAMGWMAAGWSTTVLATLYVLVHDVLLRQPETLSVLNLGLADLLYMSTYPLVMIGQLRLPRARQPLPSLVRIILDSATFILGVGVPLWVFALQPSLGKSQGLQAFVTLGFPLLAFIGMVAVNFVLLRCVPLPSRRGFNLLLAGTALSWVSDLVFSLVITQQMKVPNLFHVSNVFSMSSLLLILVGAWRISVDPVPPQPRRPASFSPIPMITIVVVAIWLARFMDVFELNAATLQRVFVGVFVLFFVLILREGLAARDGIRQATEAVTTRLRARFEALVRHSSDLILVVDPEGSLTFCSPATAKLFGGPTEDFQGRLLADFIHPEDRGLWAALLEELKGWPHSRSVQQWRMRNPEGEWRVFEASASNHLEDPDVGGLVLNARDITERRTLEERLRQVMKMEALGRLAGGVAHDFNNLLSAVLSNVELGRMDLPEGHPLGPRLARIQDAATRGARLTGRLLAFTRRESPYQSVLDGGKLLEGLLPLVEGLVGEGARLEWAVAPGTGSFWANQGDVEQGLLNLVINARDAMPQGGKILLSARNGELIDPGQMDFLSPAPGPYVVLEVADTGQGMDEQVMSHLFEPFFTTKGGEKGTGLGLTGVYGVVKSSNGGIVVQSHPGQGTRFQMWFPRVAPVTAEIPVSTPSTGLGGTETLLLVEDEPAVQEATLEILSSLGYRVFATGSAEEARAFLGDFKGQVDLLITDVIMPGDSGPKLAAELVRARPGLRVLYISGYTANELAAHGLAHPGAPLLEKPFTIKQIEKRVREVLDAAPA